MPARAHTTTARAAQEMTMFENVNSGLQPSVNEIEHNARKARSFAVHAYMRCLAHQFGEWLRLLARLPGRLTQRMAAERRRQAAIRALCELDDRMLADIGIVRSEVELCERSGNSAGTVRKLRQRQHGWSDTGPRREAA
jgi:uncharacterized protein YjiS (DUF1127 family)